MRVVVRAAAPQACSCATRTGRATARARLEREWPPMRRRYPRRAMTTRRNPGLTTAAENPRTRTRGSTRPRPQTAATRPASRPRCASTSATAILTAAQHVIRTAIARPGSPVRRVNARSAGSARRASSASPLRSFLIWDPATPPAFPAPRKVIARGARRTANAKPVRSAWGNDVRRARPMLSAARAPSASPRTRHSSAPAPRRLTAHPEKAASKACALPAAARTTIVRQARRAPMDSANPVRAAGAHAAPRGTARRDRRASTAPAGSARPTKIATEPTAKPSSVNRNGWV